MLDLFFDTETSGLWRDNLDPQDPSQPHLLQLSAELVSWNGRDARTEATMSAIIKPDGWSIEPQAYEVHGISERRAYRIGLPLNVALSYFANMVRHVDGAIVNHHVHFDRAVVTAAIWRAGYADLWWRKLGNQFFCTMEATAAICALPGVIPGEPKYPTLDEAHARLVPEIPFHSRHDSWDDLQAAKRIYQALQEHRSGDENQPAGDGVR